MTRVRLVPSLGISLNIFQASEVVCLRRQTVIHANAHTHLHTPTVRNGHSKQPDCLSDAGVGGGRLTYDRFLPPLILMVTPNGSGERSCVLCGGGGGCFFLSGVVCIFFCVCVCWPLLRFPTAGSGGARAVSSCQQSSLNGAAVIGEGDPSHPPIPSA